VTSTTAYPTPPTTPGGSTITPTTITTETTPKMSIRSPLRMAQSLLSIGVRLGSICALAWLAGCGGAVGPSKTSSVAHSRPAEPIKGDAERVPVATSAPGDATSAPGDATSAPGGASSAQKPLRGRVITIDPGHDGGNFTHAREIGRLVNDGNGEKECDTTGTAAPDGYREADFNWSVAVRLRALLLAAGARAVMTRTSNTGVGPCVTERAAIGNRARSDAAISIHADGGPPHGSGFAILTPASIPSRANQAIIRPSLRLAVALRASLSRIGLHPSTYDGVDGLAPRTDLGGLNLSRVPKVFVEVANMQDAGDEAPLERPAFRAAVARSLLAGLERFVVQGR
jgi:N-acetylmuramoyl-L-alanine amidase